MQQCLNPANWGIQGRNGNEKRSKKWFLFVYLFFCILNIQKPAETLSAILAWTNSHTHSPSCSLSPPLSLKEAAFCDLQIEADHVTSGRFVNQERGGSWGWNCLKGKAALFHSHLWNAVISYSPPTHTECESGNSIRVTDEQNIKTFIGL